MDNGGKVAMRVVDENEVLESPGEHAACGAKWIEKIPYLPPGKNHIIICPKCKEICAVITSLIANQ